MKYFNKKSLILVLTTVVGFLSMYNSAGPAASGNGDRTGSPFANATGKTCNSAGGCHNQSPGSFTPVITIQLLNSGTLLPVTTYVALTSYVLQISVSSATSITANTRYGYQAVAVTSSNLANTGSWGALPSGYHTAFTNSRSYAEQGTPSTSNSVNLPWTAPVAGSGAVKFYAAANIVDFDGTDHGDNSKNDSLLIPEFVPCSAPTVVPAISQQVQCHNGASGAITLAVSGGTPPYNYSWTGPFGFTANTQNISNLIPGTYISTVSSGTCFKKDTVVLTNPPSISITGLVTTVLCEGNTLNLSKNATGGSGTLTYSWTGPNGFTSALLSPSIPNVPIVDSGLYTLTVTDANSCTKTANLQVTINPGIIVTGTPVSPTCGGNANGSIILTVGGSGAQPFTYMWTGPNGFTSTNQNISGLAGGTYTVVAHQASGSCTQTYTTTLTTPVAIVATASVATPVCQGSVLALSGSGSGGSGTLIYHWTGPNGFQSANPNPTVSNAVPFSASGVYTLGVTDATGCNAASTVTVTVDSVPTVTATPIAALCNGASTGGVNVTAVNGAPYTYSYTGPNSYTATTQNISNVPAGTYTVIVTSNLGCAATKTATVTQPATAVIATASSNTPICVNGALNLFANGNGGTGALNYSWTGPNGFSSTQQNPTINNATAVNTGNYTLNVKDANNCSYLTATNVVLSVQPVITATVTSPTCNGANNGSIAATVTGGAPPFTFQYNGPNGYTSNQQNPGNLAAGTYTISVVGACTGQGNTTAVITQPAPLTDSISGNNPVCAGTLLTLSGGVTGGTGNYTYGWTGPNNFVSTSANPVILAITTAGGGQYTLVAKDGNNCIKIAQYNVVVDTVPVINLKDTSYCPGATVALNAGNNGAAYLWSTGAITQTINVGIAGTYNIAVTNAYGCPATKNIQVSAGSKPVVDSIRATVVTGNPGGYNFAAINPRSVTAYVWDFGDGANVASAAPVHFYVATGTYAVTLLAINVCGIDTVNKKVTVTAVTGVQNVTAASSVNVYPNPASNYVVITNTGGVVLKSIKVLNVLGAKVYEGRIDNLMYNMNTSAFAPGTYTLYIETAEGITVRKLEIIK
jgi:hypothetical protein